MTTTQVRRNESENSELLKFGKFDKKKNRPVYPHFNSSGNALCLIIFNIV